MTWTPPRTPSPSELYHQAEHEHPENTVARRTRYLELMREHGLIIAREPGEDDGLVMPCGTDLGRCRICGGRRTPGGGCESGC